MRTGPCRGEARLSTAGVVRRSGPGERGRLRRRTDVQPVSRQLRIRDVLQRGVLPPPKTTTPSRMVEHADLEFVISETLIALLVSLTGTAPQEHGPRRR